jgi:hypothetical protein
MFDLKYNGELPNINLTDREIQYFSNKFQSNKPILLLQTNGGAQTEHKYSWARDIPSSTVIEIINHFKNDYNIVHIKREDQIGYADTTPVSDTFRGLCVLIQQSTKRLLIDSFAQHVASALEMPSSVCWIANSPKVFGYELHDNILANKFNNSPELKNSYLSKFNITGDILEFPYNSENDVFDTKSIIESLSK